VLKSIGKARTTFTPAKQPSIEVRKYNRMSSSKQIAKRRFLRIVVVVVVVIANVVRSQASGPGNSHNNMRNVSGKQMSK